MQAYYIIPSLIFSAVLFTLLFLAEPDDEKIPTTGGPLYLTPYIKQGNIEEGRLAAKVGPPFDVFAEANYAGYFTVDEATNSNLFFWFFVAEINWMGHNVNCFWLGQIKGTEMVKSLEHRTLTTPYMLLVKMARLLDCFVKENDPLSSPLILWLNGGPGCSSLAVLFTGGGPFSTDSAGETLISNPYSWHQNHNVLYLDQPVHTGFSFANSSYYVTYSDEAATHMYSALTQFFQIFSEFKETPFFIAGESYAGKYVPAIAIRIHRMNQKMSSNKINLKGIAIGNGMVDLLAQADIINPAFEAGLIDLTTKVSLEKVNEFSKTHLRAPAGATDNLINDQSKECNIFQAVDNIKTSYANNCNESTLSRNGLDDNHKKDCDRIKEMIEIYNPAVLNQRGYWERECIFEQLITKIETVNINNFLQDTNINGMQFGIFLNNSKNKHFLHALDKVYPMNGMVPCEDKVNIRMTNDKSISMIPYLEELLENYKVLMYSGQLDLLVGYSASVNLIYQLNWTGAENYKLAKRKLWKVDGKTVGYIKTVLNFSEVLVRNAGHSVIQDQPHWAQILFTNFTWYSL